MKNKIIDKTETTPKVVIDYLNSKVSFEGICVPENPTAFFEPIYNDVNQIIDSNAKLTYDFYLEYFNTSSSKKILDLFMLATNHNNDDANYKVVWKTEEEDEELIEAGEIMQELTHLPFEFIEIKEEND